MNVTATFLPTLQVTPALGRNFTAEEDRPGGNTRVVLISDGFWRRAFGADPSVIGRPITLNSSPTRSIGVLPPTFQLGQRPTICCRRWLRIRRVIAPIIACR